MKQFQEFFMSVALLFNWQERETNPKYKHFWLPFLITPTLVILQFIALEKEIAPSTNSTYFHRQIE